MSESHSPKGFFESLVGSKLSNRYHLLSLLGAGSLGVVYKAHDSSKDRTVAIKMLRDNPQLEQEYFSRFEREAIAISKLKHPHIITIFDLIWEKHPYLIMDFIDGISLQDILRGKQRLSEERAGRLFIQACDALTEAHRHGVIHRDIKPSNMMLTKDELGNDFLKIMDFGIRHLTETKGVAVKLTAAGEAFGTPTYMSPEQCMGQKIDHRSDIYSLGCVMYEALTGELPITGDSFLSLIHGHVNQLPLSFKRACPGVTISSRMEKIVLKSLSKDINLRYQSMHALKEELFDLIEGKKLIETPNHIKVNNNPRSVGFTKHNYSEDLDNFSEIEEIEAEEVVILKAIEEEENRNGEDSAALVPLLEKLSALYADIEEYDKAEKEYTRAIQIFRKYYGNSLGTAELMRALAKLNYDRSKFDEAEHGYRTVLEITETALGSDDVEVLYCLEDLAMVLGQKKKFAESEEFLTAATRIVKKVFGTHHIQYARLLSFYAMLYAFKNYGTEQEKYLKQALSIAQDVLKRSDLALIPFLEDLAYFKLEEDEIDEAVKLFERVFNIAKHDSNEDCKELSSVSMTLAELFLAIGDIDQAAKLSRIALDSIKSIYGKDCAERHEPLILLGDCAMEKKRFDAAANLYGKAFELAIKIFGGDDPRVLVSMSRLAQSLQPQGFKLEAEALFNDVLSIAERSFEPNSIDIAEHRLNLAMLYLDTRRYLEAEVLLKQVQAVYEDNYQYTDEEFLPLIEAMVDVYRHLGHTERTKHYRDWLQELA